MTSGLWVREAKNAVGALLSAQCKVDWMHGMKDRTLKVIFRSIKELNHDGMVYDFETGFGTLDMNETYLLLHDLATKIAENLGQA